jgi:hypothetical protein
MSTQSSKPVTADVQILLTWQLAAKINVTVNLWVQWEIGIAQSIEMGLMAEV